MKRLLVVAASALALAGPAMAQNGAQSGPQGAPRVDVAAAAEFAVSLILGGVPALPRQT